VNHGGVITNAVSSQDWSGEAAVDVSIVNWIKEPADDPRTVTLDGIEVGGISPALTSVEHDVSSAVSLPANHGRCFYGPIPGGQGFILGDAEAAGLLSRSDADYHAVVRPYLIGRDIVNSPRQDPSRFIIDFGFRPLEEAKRYPAALRIVEERVRPERRKTRRRAYRENWWRFSEPIVAMRDALAPLSRYIAANTQGKRILFCWVGPETCPSNLTTVFAFEDDFSIGVLSSTIHHEWARAQSSTLEDRFRYTATSAFETFPWPQPDDRQKDAVAEAGRLMLRRRSEICVEREIGLTRLYNEVEDGAYRDLAALHQRLDGAVAEAYGWPPTAANDPLESNRLLLDLNQRIAAGERDYQPFGS
jgi:hypothetical protein